MTIHMPKINISNSGGGGGGGETTEVYLTDMQRDYPVHPVSRGDKFYDTEDKVIVTSLIDNPAGYVWEFCSRETPKYGVFYIYENVAYVWNGEDLVRFTASNNYMSLENKPMINGETLIGDEDGEHYGLVDKATFINKLYPTGTILFTYTKVSPATYIGGTWELIEEGYYPVATVQEAIAEEDRKLSPILPKFTGELSIIGRGSSRGWLQGSGIVKVKSTSSGNTIATSGSDSGLGTAWQINSEMEANSIYKGKKDEVKPKSILLYMWRRIDSGQLTYNFVNLSFSATDFAVDQATGQVSLRNGIYYYTPNEIPRADENGKLISSGVKINDIVLNTRKVAGCALDYDITDTEIQNAIKDCIATLTNKTIDADDNFISNLETENIKSSAMATSQDNVRNYDTSVDTKLTTEKFVQKVLKNIPTPTGNNDAVNKEYVDNKSGDNTSIIVLLALSETNPSAPFSKGSKYYNTSTKRIYTASADDVWDTLHPENPTVNTLYICNNVLYVFNGNDLVVYREGEISLVTESGISLPDPNNYEVNDKFLVEEEKKIHTVKKIEYQLQNYDGTSTTLPTFNKNTGVISGFREGHYQHSICLQSIKNANASLFRKLWTGIVSLRFHIGNLVDDNREKVICAFFNEDMNGNDYNWGIYYCNNSLYWAKLVIDNNEGITEIKDATKLCDFDIDNENLFIEIKRAINGNVTTKISTLGYGINTIVDNVVNIPDYGVGVVITNWRFSYSCKQSTVSAHMGNTYIYLADSFASENFVKEISSQTNKVWDLGEPLIDKTLYLDKTNKKLLYYEDNKIIACNTNNFVDGSGNTLPDPSQYNKGKLFLHTGYKKIYILNNFKFALRNYSDIADTLPDFNENNCVLSNFSTGSREKFLKSISNNYPDTFNLQWKDNLLVKFKLRDIETSAYFIVLCAWIKVDTSNIPYGWGFVISNQKIYFAQLRLNASTYAVERVDNTLLLTNFVMSAPNKDYYITINRLSTGKVITTISENSYAGNVLAQNTVNCSDYEIPNVNNYFFMYGCTSSSESFSIGRTKIYLAESFAGDILSTKIADNNVKNWSELEKCKDGNFYLDKNNKKIYLYKNNQIAGGGGDITIGDLITDDDKQSEILTDSTTFTRVNTTTKKNIIYKMLQVWNYIIGKLQPTMDDIINAVNNLSNNKADKSFTYAGLLNGQGATITIPKDNSNWKEMCVIMRVMEGAYYYQHCEYILRETFSEGSPDGVYVLFNYGSTASDGTGTFYSARVRLKYNSSTRVLTNNFTTVQAWQFVNAKIYVR